MATRAVPLLGVVYIFGHFGPTQTVPGAPNIGHYLYSAVRGPSGDPAQKQFKYRAILRRRLGTWRRILSTTSRFLVLMRLDLFFTGVPNFPPPAEAVMLRVGGERALLLTGNFWCL